MIYDDHDDDGGDGDGDDDDNDGDDSSSMSHSLMKRITSSDLLNFWWHPPSHRPLVNDKPKEYPQQHGAQNGLTQKTRETTKLRQPC